MAKTELEYTISNRLDLFLNREIGRRMTSNGGIKVTKKHIIGEIAEYRGLTWEELNRIKREMSVPSLPVALKICKYFGANVEAIFSLEEY